MDDIERIDRDRSPIVDGSPRSDSVHSRNSVHSQHSDGDRVELDRKRRFSDREPDYQRYSPPAPPVHRDYRDDSYLAVRGRENQIGQRVMDALNDIEKRHEDDNVHPLDLKKQKHQEVARKRDKAMIWAAATE